MSIPDTVKFGVDASQEDGDDVEGKWGRNMDGEMHSHTHLGYDCHALHYDTQNRYHSFAPQRAGGNAKWYVDGCGYFWALSIAIEDAQHDIWIMGWWLTPELFLRRPPSKNLQYRLDRMLQAAAGRGVKVNVIINNASSTSCLAFHTN
jgi:phospholipase D1/2